MENLIGKAEAYAFVQHMIASMAESGSSRIAVALPQGGLFRKSAEGKIREALLKEDQIEAVIGAYTYIHRYPPTLRLFAFTKF